MFGDRYFGPRYFGDRYFGEGSTGTPPAGGDPSVSGSNNNRSFAHRAWFCLVPFLLLLTSCGTELIGPAHEEYEARCTLYVSETGWVDMPREMIESCFSVRLQVIEWEG